MKELEAENARLRRAVSDLMLDKMILARAANGKNDFGFGMRLEWYEMRHDTG